MKTTFKKTIAAMSAATVVAASAAVMAVPASAATDAAVTIGTVEVTVSELKANDYKVEVPVTISNNPGFNNIGFTVNWNTAEVNCDKDNVKVVSGMNGAVSKEGSLWFSLLDTAAITGDCQIGTMTFTVNENAAAGETYTIEGVNLDSEGNPAPFGKDGEDLGGLAAVNSGAIVIVADPTEATTTAATTTGAAPATTTTTAAVASPTKKPTTGSPKTGDALPVAGVAVAVAVIGGVALVSKKRK